MTKRENFETIKTYVSAVPELVEFCNHEIELLDRRLNKNQKANEEIKVHIVKAIEEIGEPCPISKITEKLPGYSTQKISALLSQLVKKDNKVVKSMNKRVSYFSLA